MARPARFERASAWFEAAQEFKILSLLINDLLAHPYMTISPGFADPRQAVFSSHAVCDYIFTHKYVSEPTLLILISGVSAVKCPKCGHPQPSDSSICSACGIVFEKYYKHHSREGKRYPKPDVGLIVYGETESIWRRLQLLALPQDAAKNSLPISIQVLILMGLAYWSFQLIGSTIESNAVGNSFLHLVNLPFHEAGHVVFRPFGEFMTSFGGTLGQFIMPQIAGWTLLLKTRDPFGAAICLWWFGENFLDIAPYINDARAGELHLVGGNFGHSSPYGFHDWEYLLTESGLISWDHTLANISFVVGSTIMILAIVWAMWLVKQRWKMNR